jgi:hypothetical protein
MFKIEKGVPLIPRPGGRTGSKYPLDEMEVGDSFLVEGGTVKNLSCTIRAHAKKVGGKFATRTVEGGVRVWRTE